MVGAVRRRSPMMLRHLQGLQGSIAQCLDSPQGSPTGDSPCFLDTASGASAVAIDNKIEQAMDLVKSHLMFAVREEVEVLKDKIAELMDRINQLELENSILKAHATQETLEQLVAGKAVMDVPPAAAPEQQNGIATP
ncbi:protein bunched, class 1/class 3/D/E isoforms-like isoform X3 [Thrips palmi]|uniref:Protein bunched, class 1/class 3/D/E isoforms-like isoform X3 n=1 Tax=Thrips palmi TaxID=161013 RepID=A0A6P8ZSU6_THRPL|nr:protein bunched, class 1/class 3/D/E isoforms-like isoform X3 [Thrips palmi]